MAGHFKHLQNLNLDKPFFKMFSLQQKHPFKPLRRGVPNGMTVIVMHPKLVKKPLVHGKFANNLAVVFHEGSANCNLELGIE